MARAINTEEGLKVLGTVVDIVGDYDQTEVRHLTGAILEMRSLQGVVKVSNKALRDAKHRHGSKAHTTLRRRDQNTWLRGNRGIDVDYANWRNVIRERDARNDLREQEVELNNEQADSFHQLQVINEPVAKSLVMKLSLGYDQLPEAEQIQCDIDLAWKMHADKYTLTQDEIRRQTDDAWAVHEDYAITYQRLVDLVDTLGQL